MQDAAFSRKIERVLIEKTTNKVDSLNNPVDLPQNGGNLKDE
jgi:hypothetical protein